VPAKALLRGSEQGYIDACLVVTAGEARALDEVLVTAGFERDDSYRTNRHSWSGEYRIVDGSTIAVVGVHPVQPNATFEQWREL